MNTVEVPPATKQAASRMVEALADGPVGLAIRKLSEHGLYHEAGRLSETHTNLMAIAKELDGTP
jgi:hypothetical protein